jgi:hypothetical protein
MTAHVGGEITCDLHFFSTQADISDTAERNERSTPRSFVLPATPAVALEQERQMAGEAEFRLIHRADPGKREPNAMAN